MGVVSGSFLSNRPLIQPQWNGFPLEGRTILMITEQGFGDVMRFIRMESSNWPRLPASLK